MSDLKFLSKRALAGWLEVRKDDLSQEKFEMNAKRTMILIVVLITVAAVIAACGGSSSPLDALVASVENKNVVFEKSSDPTSTFKLDDQFYPVSYFSLEQAGTVIFIANDGHQEKYQYPAQWILAIQMNNGQPPITIEEFPYAVVVGDDNIAVWRTKDLPIQPGIVAPTPFKLPSEKPAATANPAIFVTPTP